VTDATPRAGFSHVETPLVPSRSLGPLLGFGALAFKLETCQPTGSWLDRDAALLVQRAVASGLTGLCGLADSPLALPLAVQCARAGLRLVLLGSRHRADQPTCRATQHIRSPATDSWLAALGARQITVDADWMELAATVSQIAGAAGLELVEMEGSVTSAGLEAAANEVIGAGFAASLLVVPAFASAGPAGHLLAPVLGVLTVVELDVAVTAREADAARVLLAREEGLLASVAGAAALAALVRTVREDRARRPRERRFPRDLTAVVVLTGEPPGAGGSPPPPADAVPGRAVSLAELMADPGRLLVEPPGSG
jgi:hypothetical protein